MYFDVVLGVDNYEFEDILEDYKECNDLIFDNEISVEVWVGLIEKFKVLVEDDIEKLFL